MTVNCIVIGTTQMVGLDLTTTSETTIWNADASNEVAFVDSIDICNDSGSACHFTLTLYKNSTAYKIYNQKSVASNDTLRIQDFNKYLHLNWSLKITAQTANALHVTALVLRAPAVRG